MRFTIGLPITKTKYLKESLDSIDAQTFTDFEVIIRNNAKTPTIKAEIKDICKDWIGRTNVTYEESTKQLSMPANFNKILEIAKGEQFTIISDDDVMDQEYLNEFHNLSKKYPDTKVFHCRVKMIDGQNEFLGITEICPEWESQEDFIFQRLYGNRDFFLSDFIVNTKALQEIMGFSEDTSGWGVDEMTWSTLAFNGVGFSNKLLLKYRIFPGNFSLSLENLKQRFQDIEAMHQNMERIIKETCNESDSFYPLQYMLDLNHERTKKQNNLVFRFYTQSGNLFQNILFFIENKSRLKGKTALKNLFKSLL